MTLSPPAPSATAARWDAADQFSLRITNPNAAVAGMDLINLEIVQWGISGAKIAGTARPLAPEMSCFLTTFPFI